MYELTRLLHAADDGGGAGDGEAPPGEGDKGKAETFTKEQMEQYMNHHLGKARKGWEREREQLEKNLYTKLGISSAEEIEQLNELRQKAANEEERKKLERGEFERISAERETKFKKREQELIDQKAQSDNNFLDLAKEINLGQAALKAGADPATLDLVIAFTKTQVKVMDKNTVVPIDSHGEVPLNPDTGKEMTLDDFMKSFLAERPNLVKGSGTGGAGSSSGGGKGRAGLPTLEQVKKAAQSNPEQYEKWRKDGTLEAVQEIHTKT